MGRGKHRRIKGCLRKRHRKQEGQQRKRRVNNRRYWEERGRSEERGRVGGGKRKMETAREGSMMKRAES